MAAVEALILNGHVTLLALGVLLLEAIWLLAFRRALPVSAVLANGLAGIFLILALRAALLGPDARGIATWLCLGLIAHLADLRLRLRR